METITTPPMEPVSERRRERCNRVLIPFEYFVLGVRDYIHVVDLAIGHLQAISHQRPSGFQVYNLGTGRGYSVLEIIAAFKAASGKDIPYEIVDRRPGDIATSYADASRANKELEWQATRNIDDMCKWKRLEIIF